MLNRGKRSFVLDLGKPAGRELLKKLVAKSDMVLDNFTPRVSARLGPALRATSQVEPRVDHAVEYRLRQHGPVGGVPQPGNDAGSDDGHYALLRISQRQAVEGRTIVPRFPGLLVGAVAHCWLRCIIGAKRAKGSGSTSACTRSARRSFPRPMLQLQADGSDWERIGNEHRTLAPYNVYPAGDDDAWIAISITNEEQWQQLVHVMGKAELLSDTRFRDMQTRLQNREALDELMAGWTRERDAGEMTALLQGGWRTGRAGAQQSGPAARRTSAQSPLL